MPPSQQSVEKVYITTSLITGAMIVGVLIFAGIAWFMRQGAEVGTAASISATQRLAWYMIAAGSLVGAMTYRQRLRTQLENPGVHDAIRNGTFTPMHVQNAALIIWALIEGPSLMGVVLYLIGGPVSMLVATVAYVAVGALFYFPRRAWFDVFRQLET